MRLNSALLLYLYFFNIMIFPNGSMISKILKIVCVALSFIYLLKKHLKIKVCAFNIWSFIITLFSACSITWSLSAEYAISGTGTIFLNYLCIFFMIQILVQEKDNLKILINAMTLFPTFKFIRLFLVHGLTIFGGLRSIQGGTHNLTGMYAAFGAVFCYWAIKEKIYTRLNFKILLFINVGVCCLTMSRKAFLYLLIPWIIMNLFAGSSKKRIRRTFFVLILLMCGYVLIMKVPFLYQYVGHGFESLLTFFTSDSGDLSASGRRTRILFGMEMFDQHPWLGWGTMNYNYLFFRATKGIDMVIADNNFVDILVNWGVVGLFLYYSLYLFLMITFAKSFFIRKQRQLFTVFPFAILVTLLICDYGVSAYLYLHSQTYLAIAAILICNNCWRDYNKKDACETACVAGRENKNFTKEELCR